MAKRKIEPHDLPGFEAIPAVVVADKTNKMGDRLFKLAFGLLLVFFAVSGYIQSAQNGESLSAAKTQLDQAALDRTKLAEAVELFSQQSAEDRTLILRLSAVIAEQNNRLRDAGIPPVDLGPIREDIKVTPLTPGSVEPSSGSSAPGEVGTAPEPSMTPANSSPAQPAPKPEPDPQPAPEPAPEPEPEGPFDVVTEPVCNALGICL